MFRMGFTCTDYGKLRHVASFPHAVLGILLSLCLVSCFADASLAVDFAEARGKFFVGEYEECIALTRAEVDKVFGMTFSRVN